MDKNFWKMMRYHLTRMFVLSIVFAIPMYVPEKNISIAFNVWLVSFSSYKLGAVAQMLWEDRKGNPTPRAVDEG